MRGATEHTLQSLATLARICGVAGDQSVLDKAEDLYSHGMCSDDVVLVAKRLGLEVHRYFNQTEKQLLGLRRPAILRRNDGVFVVALPALFGDTLPIIDPTHPTSNGRPQRLAIRSLMAEWSGECITGSAAAQTQADAGTFGFRWFLPTLWRYRRPLAHVLLASLFVQLFALATPLFFQIIVDKVLVHKALATLTVVTVGLVVTGLFDASLQYLRAYLLAHTANRLDVELGARLFRHLFSLPLAYFDVRPTGQTVARIRELENIRRFLTGQGLTAAIDCAFAVLLIAVLMFYSITLTLVVVVSIPIYVAVAIGFKPVLRARLQEMYTRGALSQQFLVESIIGVHTLKAAAAEPLIERQWSEKLAAYMCAAFQSTMVASAGQNVVQYLTRLSSAMILFSARGKRSRET